MIPIRRRLRQGGGGRAATVLVFATLLLLVVSVAAAQDCELYRQETFPYGSVWWKVDPAREGSAKLGEAPEGRTAYLVIAVRPEGILVQNREARYPRLLSWKVVARSLISLDGRRSWRPGCGS